MSRTESRRPQLAIGILVSGAILHVFLCGPAIGCRGYPPLDPIWYGVTFLWPVSIVISAYFDSSRFGVRRTQLLLFALSTAFFSAGTLISVVPRRMGPVEMLFNTFFIGPIHLLIAFVVEVAAQAIYSTGRRLVDPPEATARFRISLFFCLALLAWINLALGIPLGYQAFARSTRNNAAIRRANDDWKTNARIDHAPEYEEFEGCAVWYAFDRKTGLEFKRRMANRAFADRYNARIEELISLYGLPEYSVKSFLPKPQDLVQMLDSTDMTFVDAIPAVVEEAIHLTRRRTFTGWGGDLASGRDSLTIETRHTSIDAGDGVLPVHVKITDNIIYIRNGRIWVGAFLPDGRLVVSASRRP